MTLKVAAYITAYQEEDAVQSTIESLLHQSHRIDKILIIDNSPTALTLNAGSGSLLIEHHPENVGVGGGLKWAIGWAIKEGYDFLWTLDQDSQLYLHLLDELLSQYERISQQIDKIGIIAPKIFDTNSQHEFPGSSFDQYRIVPHPHYALEQKFYTCDAVITSGSLISMEAAKSVALPNESYFLDAVDYGYCINFRKAGYRVVVCKELILKHRIGRYDETCDRFNKKAGGIKTFLCSPSRYYYACRNHTHLETRLSSKRVLFKALTHRLHVLCMFLTRILRYEPDRIVLKATACLLGTFDGLIGRLGKTW